MFKNNFYSITMLYLALDFYIAWYKWKQEEKIRNIFNIITK